MAPLILALLVAAGPWEYRAGAGFVNVKTMESRTPEQFLQLGKELVEAKKVDEAAELLAVLVEAPVENPFREAGSFLRGRVLAENGRTYDGYLEFDRFTRLFPESPQSPKAREWLMACGLALAKEGHKDFLFFKTSKTGLDALHQTLLRFPREDFTDDYYLKLARFYLDRGDLDLAESELRTILDNYKASDSAPRALLLLADIGRRRFDHVAYDVKALLDAKRAYEQFLGDYGRLVDDPVALRAAGLEDDKLPPLEREARDGISWINDRLAEKELSLAKFYLRKDKPKAARIYLRTIVKKYGESSSSLEARELLDRIGNED